MNNVLRRYDDRTEEMKHLNNLAMLSYRLKCRENTESKNILELQRQIKLMLSSKHKVYDGEKSRFIKEQ